jgi:uncharacterized protein involved in exopolysaccharide biosynthesis
MNKQHNLTIDRSSLEGEPRGYFVVLSAAEDKSGDMDIADIVARLLHGKWWIVGAMLICVLLAALHAYTAVPIYRAEGSYVIRSDEHGGALGAITGQLGGLASLAGIGLGDDGSRRKTSLAVLKSRELAAEFAEKHNLMQLFYKSRWDQQTKTYRGTLFRPPPTFNDAVNAVEGLRKIKEEPKTGLITLSFEWVNRDQATRWVNDYAAMANEKLRQKAIRSAQQSLKYLEDQLAATSQEPIRQSLYRIMESRLNEVMLASVEPEYAFQVIDRAVMPDAHRFVRPKRAFEIVFGAAAGFAIGALYVLWRFRKLKASS